MKIKFTDRCGWINMRKLLKQYLEGKIEKKNRFRADLISCFNSIRLAGAKFIEYVIKLSQTRNRVKDL